MQAFADPLPFLPFFLEPFPHIVHLILLHFVCDCHMRSETIMLLIYYLWELLSCDIVDLLQRVSEGRWIEEDNSMREA